MAEITVNEADEVKPPVTVVGPLAWLRKKLFSTWYNVVMTVLFLWLAYALAKPAYQWASTEARWGVIEANLTLFMIGQYPREQIGRVWLLGRAVLLQHRYSPVEAHLAGAGGTGLCIGLGHGFGRLTLSRL